MEVYIEYVIIDNFIIDTLVLLCVKATMKLNVKFWKICFSALFGTFCACMYPLIGLSDFILFPIKLIIGVAMVLMVRKYNSLKEFFFAMILFIFYTMLSVGACIVTLMLFGTDINQLTSGYSVEFPVGVVLLTVALYVAIIISLAKYLTRRKDISQFVKQIKLTISGKTLEINGFVDTGNSLIDQKSGLPVIILSLSCLEKFFTEQQIQDLMLGDCGSGPFRGVHKLSYGTICGQDRKMVVFDADGLVINADGYEYKTNNFVVGVTYRKFNDAIKYDLLLHPAIL